MKLVFVVDRECTIEQVLTYSCQVNSLVYLIKIPKCTYKVVFMGRLSKSKVYVHCLNGLSIQEIVMNYELL